VQTHGNLAVRNFAQRAAILPPHAHRVLPGLRESGFVDDPDFGLAEKIHHFVRQTPLDLFHRPGALSQKLTQGLYVRSFQTAGHRLNRFAFSVQQQALHVDARPVAAFTAAHRFGQVLQKVLQVTIQCFQGSRCHGVTLPCTEGSFKMYLT
jgi:hypothetical protein